jgi:HTH-type transcriptional regulator/antitoxin HipB
MFPIGCILVVESARDRAMPTPKAKAFPFGNIPGNSGLTMACGWPILGPVTPNGNRQRAAPRPAARLDLGQWVRDRRTANGMTQTELALLAGVGRRLVSELERGKASLQLVGVDAVLAVFGKRLGVEDLPRERIDGEPTERTP